MKTTLYRPIGLKELQLIIDSDFKAFPPRLEWQPIFYPVLNQEYAEQIAEKWNTKDEFSGYCGIVTKFDLPASYLQKYEVHNVGGFIHNELWVPAEDLNEFNSKIIGQIEIVKVFAGESFVTSVNDAATQYVLKYLDR
ncbi:ADP-ribosylation/crystallin J1 [Dysgonomonas sp. 520]|uniref:ADP-ribosylation/crystallin J1 n=1 Tax=Dysgonomonas sp. 520 TaxID=2302931 RepID=UPI0013D0CCC9|nr:ADP-ribosylation/crystallin J1 [Dysgonomonas sp. 520]NDW08863.1 ADP-ribosylation/crystallin J1 [Dysgonomonas sp. 520]